MSSAIPDSEIKRAERTCPCHYTTPCHEQCACVNEFSSSACRCCAGYGSLEQRKKTAERLAGLQVEVKRQQQVIGQLVEALKNTDCTGNYLMSEHCICPRCSALAAAQPQSVQDKVGSDG